MSQRSISQLFIKPLGPRYAKILATLSLSAAVALASATAVAQQPEHAHQTDHVTAQSGQDVAATTPAAQRKAATDSTEAFLSAHKQWAQAQGSSNKAVALQSLIAKAEARRTMLAELVQTNPAEALRVAIPEEKQLGMPAEVLDLLEQKIDIEGEAEVFYEDYSDGAHKLRSFINTPFGERLELSIVGSNTPFEHNQSVDVSGVLFANSDTTTDGTLVAEAGSVITAECCTDSSSSTPPTAGNYTFGEQKTLVMLVNFQDKPQQPWTKEEVRNVVFNSANDFYLENSNGQTWLSGDVTGWYTIPMSSAACDQWALAAAADEAATASGVNLSNYNRRVYVFPKSGCGWTGLGSVGGKSSWAWLNGALSTYLVGHEMGHNFGLGHSMGLECESDIIEGSCYPAGYANRLDAMGSPNPGHFNAFQKERLGWISQQDLQTITNSDTFTLSQYAGTDTGTKALKVLQGIDPLTGQETSYYIEFRQPVGFDSFIDDPDNLVDALNVMNGVVINRGNLNVWDSSRLLDMTPGSTVDNYYDFNDPALEAGKSFYDPSSGVQITTNWVNSTQANVTITVDQSSCTEAAPQLSITSQNSEWVTAGTAVEYVLTVANTNSLACGPSTYNLSSSAPSGWTAAFSNQTVTLSPGETVSSSLFVTSPTSASNGFYDIPITLSGGNSPVSDSVTYVIDSLTQNSAPLAIDDSASTSAGAAVTIDVLNNDSDPDGDSLNITSTIAVNGSTVINGDGTITYTPAAGFTGNETLSYSISDGNGGSDSAAVTVNVSAIANQPPVALNDSTTTLKNTAVIIQVMDNDYDPEGDSLQVISVSQGAKGQVTLNNDGTVTYMPAKSFKSSDSFSYTITDGSYSATASVTVLLDQSGDTSPAPGNGNGKGKKN